MTRKQHLNSVSDHDRYMHQARMAYWNAARARREAIRAAVAAGISHLEVADRLGVSKGMVTKLLKVSGTGGAGTPAEDQLPRLGMGTPAVELSSPPVPES